MEKKMDWCEHMIPGSVIGLPEKIDSSLLNFGSWKFCPICGTSRPKEKSKGERLAEELYEAFHAQHPHRDVFKHLADVSIAFFENNK